MSDSSIKENLQHVRESISAAAKKAGRSASEVQLLAVSKLKPIEAIIEAYSAGQKFFGENYVQEAVEKIAKLPEAEWHLIGPLQTNKVKQIIGRVRLIHTVDREKLVREIEKHAAALGITQDVLIEVHVGGEETKHGVAIDDGPKLIEEILKSPHLRLRGLMSLPPLTDEEKVARGNFATVRELQQRWVSLLPADARKNFDVLSLGTSGDFEWAILEGATLVRVGTSIFGERA